MSRHESIQATWIEWEVGTDGQPYECVMVVETTIELDIGRGDGVDSAELDALTESLMPEMEKSRATRIRLVPVGRYKTQTTS